MNDIASVSFGSPISRLHGFQCDSMETTDYEMQHKIVLQLFSTNVSYSWPFWLLHPNASHEIQSRRASLNSAILLSDWSMLDSFSIITLKSVTKQQCSPKASWANQSFIWWLESKKMGKVLHHTMFPERCYEKQYKIVVFQPELSFWPSGWNFPI